MENLIVMRFEWMSGMGWETKKRKGQKLHWNIFLTDTICLKVWEDVVVIFGIW